jgi:hypothetical protein
VDDLTDQYLVRQYLTECAYFPVDETIPHLACGVIDSNDAPGDQVLRSDVDYAIALVSFRLQIGRHTGHHTKPVCSSHPPAIPWTVPISVRPYPYTLIN